MDDMQKLNEAMSRLVEANMQEFGCTKKEAFLKAMARLENDCPNAYAAYVRWLLAK